MNELDLLLLALHHSLSHHERGVSSGAGRTLKVRGVRPEGFNLLLTR